MKKKKKKKTKKKIKKFSSCVWEKFLLKKEEFNNFKGEKKKVLYFFPSGENVTLITASEWPTSGSPSGFPDSTSQILMVLSELPEASLKWKIILLVFNK